MLCVAGLRGVLVMIDDAREASCEYGEAREGPPYNEWLYRDVSTVRQLASSRGLEVEIMKVVSHDDEVGTVVGITHCVDGVQDRKILIEVVAPD